MSNPPEITKNSFKRGDVLRKADRTATIIEPAEHRKSKKFIGFYADFLKDGEVLPKTGTLFIADIPNWKPWTAPVVAPKPITTAESTGNSTLSKLARALNEEASDELLEQHPMSKQEADAWDAVRRDIENETYKRLDAEDLAEMNPPDENADPYDVVFAEMEGDWNIVSYRNGDMQLERKVEDKTEALKVIADLEANRLELASLAQVIEQQRSEIVTLEEQLIEAAAVNDVKSDQLREMSAELKALQAPVGMIDPNPTVAPCEEFKIIREETSEGMTKMVREGWQIRHMQFTDGGDFADPFNIVYWRIVNSPASQPERATAKVVVPSAVIEPEPLATAAVEIGAEAAEFTLNQVDAAEKTSPLPRFTRQGFMKDAWEASMNAAAQVVQNRNPAYDAIFNRPNALPAVAVRPS